jgi:ribosomal protein S27E
VSSKLKKEGSQPEAGSAVDLEIRTEDGETIEMEAACSLCDNKEFWLSEDRSLLYCSVCGATLAKKKLSVLPEWEVKWEI